LQNEGEIVMWNCNYGPWAGGWGGGFFPGNLWGLLLWGLVIVLLVYLATRLFRSRTAQPLNAYRDRDDSLTILKTRLARGEISTEEYHQMKKVLSRS
jgi:putative membrane protein